MRHYLQSMEFKMAPVITRSRSRTRSETSRPEIPDPENSQPEITLPKPLLLREIIENVLPYLNTQDLDSCLQAFDIWKDLIDEEKRLRQDVYPFLWGIPCKEHGKVHDCHLPPEEPRSIHQDIRVKMKNFVSKRCVPLLFATGYIRKNAEILFPGIQPTVITDEYLRLKKLEDLEKCRYDIVHKVEKSLEKLVVKALGRYFPSSPQQAFFLPDCILGCDEDLTVIELKRHPAIAGFIIPQYPGFEIHKFDLQSEKIPVDLNIKGLLVFSINKFSFSCVDDYIRRKDIDGIAFGGHTDSELKTRLPNSTAVAFCGENVEVASLVITPFDEKPEGKLRLFEKTGQLANKCFAFAFIYCSEEEEVRFKYVKAFKKLHPNIPIWGVISDHIYGMDYLPGVLKEQKASIPEVFDRGDLSFIGGDIFVLVSIKP